MNAMQGIQLEMSRHEMSSYELQGIYPMLPYIPRLHSQILMWYIDSECGNVVMWKVDRWNPKLKSFNSLFQYQDKVDWLFEPGKVPRIDKYQC